jgi:cobalamin biosynthesis protein CobT
MIHYPIINPYSKKKKKRLILFLEMMKTMTEKVLKWKEKGWKSLQRSWKMMMKKKEEEKEEKMTKRTTMRKKTRTTIKVNKEVKGIISLYFFCFFALMKKTNFPFFKSLKKINEKALISNVEKINKWINIKIEIDLGDEDTEDDEDEDEYEDEEDEEGEEDDDEEGEDAAPSATSLLVEGPLADEEDEEDDDYEQGEGAEEEDDEDIPSDEDGDKPQVIEEADAPSGENEKKKHTHHHHTQ